VPIRARPEPLCLRPGLLSPGSGPTATASLTQRLPKSAISARGRRSTLESASDSSHTKVGSPICYYRRMRYILGFLLLLLVASALPVSAVCAASVAADSSAAGPVTTVSSVDLARYAGIWYEIAKIPNRFQKQCARSTTAEYSVRGDGQVDVVNRCIKNDGSAEQAAGVAKVVDTGTNARLKVSFVSFLGWRPFWGDYWIIGLDENYQWAIVGTPDRKYGWILARTQALDPDTMEAIFAILERNGYKRAAFATSAQGH